MARVSPFINALHFSEFIFTATLVATIENTITLLSYMLLTFVISVMLRTKTTSVFWIFPDNQILPNKQIKNRRINRSIYETTQSKLGHIGLKCHSLLLALTKFQMEFYCWL